MNGCGFISMGLMTKIVDLLPQLTEDTSGRESDESAPQQQWSPCRAVDARCPGEGQHQLIA